MKILIPNVTSPKNLGDQAMLDSLLGLLTEQFPKAEISLQGVDPHLISQTTHKNSRHSITSWLLFDNPSFFGRSRRLFLLLVELVTMRKFFFSSHDLTTILNEYKTADLVVFVGNGAIRSNTGISQSVYLLIQLLGYVAATRCNRNTIIAPMSFGPFAYPWQGRFASYVLRNIKTIYIRDAYSFTLAKQLGLPCISSHDQALLLKKKRNKKKKTTAYTVGMTMRQWLPQKFQQKLEDEIVDAILKFNTVQNIHVQPIVQVNAPEHHEYDLRVITRMTERLKIKGVKVDRIRILSSVQNAIDTYLGLDCLLGMRMHSNIIAATQNIPFIAIEYEYKTKGIAESIGMEKYSVHCEQLTQENLLKLLERVKNDKAKIKKTLSQHIKRIQLRDRKIWFSNLQKIVNSSAEVN